jgi:hypothetical protein
MVCLVFMLNTRNGVSYYKQIESNFKNYWRIELYMLHDIKMTMNRGERLIKHRYSSSLRNLFR